MPFKYGRNEDNIQLFKQAEEWLAAPTTDDAAVINVVQTFCARHKQMYDIEDLLAAFDEIETNIYTITTFVAENENNKDYTDMVKAADIIPEDMACFESSQFRDYVDTVFMQKMQPFYEMTKAYLRDGIEPLITKLTL